MSKIQKETKAFWSRKPRPKFFILMSHLLKHTHSLINVFEQRCSRQHTITKGSLSLSTGAFPGVDFLTENTHSNISLWKHPCCWAAVRR